MAQKKLYRKVKNAKKRTAPVRYGICHRDGQYSHLVQPMYWAQVPVPLLPGQDVEEGVEPVVATGIEDTHLVQPMYWAQVPGCRGGS